MSLADSSQALLSSHNGDGYHTGLDNQDDDLSSRASSQLCFSPPTPQTTNHKRARPESAQTSVCSTTPTLLQYFLLVCDLSLPLSSIHRSLQIGLADHGLPTTSISPPLLSCAVQSPSQSTSKLIYIQIMDTTLTAHIIRIVRLTLRQSMPQLISSIPPPSTIDDIDLTAFSGDGHPLFCCVTSCPYHNGRDPIFPNDDHGLDIAQAHGQHLHYDLLASLPSDSLSSIDWSRCCETCPSLFLKHTDLDAHRTTCNTYIPPPPPPLAATDAPPTPTQPQMENTLHYMPRLAPPRTGLPHQRLPQR